MVIDTHIPRRFAPRAARFSFIALVAFVAAVAVAPAGAESAPAVLTVDEAVKAAIRNNLSVKSALVNERAKKLESDFSFNKFFPSVSVSGTMLQLNEVNPSLVGVKSDHSNVYYTQEKSNLSLGLTVQEVFNPAYIVLMSQAALDYQDSSISREQAERNMTAAVKKAFYQLCVQDRTIALMRSRLEKAQERFRQAEVSYQLGQSAELNYAYASGNVENIIPQLRDMETARAVCIVQFQEILGFDSRPDMVLSGSIEGEIVTADRWSGFESGRLDVMQAEMLVKRTANGLNAQNALLLPNVILQYKMDPALNGPGTNSISDKDNWRQSSGGVSLTVAWDLSAFIPMSGLQVTRLKLKDQLELAREAELDAKRKALDDTVNKRQAIEAGLANLGNLERALAAARRAYELTDISYKAGAGRLLDLQDAELYYQQAEVSLLSEKLKLLGLAFDWDAKYGAE